MNLLFLNSSKTNLQAQIISLENSVGHLKKKITLFFFFFLFRASLWHMEVPRQGIRVKSELQLPVYTIAMATQFIFNFLLFCFQVASATYTTAPWQDPYSEGGQG